MATEVELTGLRFVEREQRIDHSGGESMRRVRILQQRWGIYEDDGAIRYEWRDVPLVEETD